MLKELKISNFRIFDEEVTVRFRPITVLIGRNNSGKSSIIKFLLMLQQSLDSGKPQFLTPEGDRVNLGIFSELKNSLTREKNLCFQLTAKGPVSPPGNLLEYVNFFGVETMHLLYSVDATVSYSDIQSGRTRYFLMSEKLPNDNLIARKGDVSNAATLLSMPPEAYRKMQFEALDATKEDEQKMKDLKMSVSRFMAEDEFLNILRYQISSVRHLSAVREDFQRVISAAPPPSGDVGQKGLYALPHLQQMADKVDAQNDFEFILPHIKNVAGIEDIRFEKPSHDWSQCLAKNHVTGANNVHIANYGLGVSQCLPIFIQGAIMPRHTSLMVEQPEAQLHPTAQLEMGEFFCDLWNKRGVGSIIETHSDNILLRLRRLIATGELSAGDVSVAYFTHDRKNGNMPVIWNLNINEDGSMQSKSPEEFLPAEFFGKNLHEVLKMMSASPK